MATRGDRGDEFAEWVSLHLMSMAHLAARLVGPVERDDIVQEALTRAWTKRHTYDPSRGTPRAWLLAIVADRAKRAQRRRRPPVVMDAGAVSAIAAVDGTSVDIERALESLTPRMRLAIDCVYFVGLTVAETAVVMGVTDGTVKSTLSDARALLRPRLGVPT